MRDYIRRAYFMYCGHDLCQLPDCIQREFADLPPDADCHDFSGDFTVHDFQVIQERHAGLDIPYGGGYHDFSADCDANHRIDIVLDMMERGMLPPDHFGRVLVWRKPQELSLGV